MEVKIEEAKPSDAFAIKEVAYYSWLATYPNEECGVTTDDIKDRLKDALSEEKVKKKAEQIGDPAEGRYIVARLGENVIGFCHVRTYPDKNHVHAFYVLPEHVGKGIGMALWLKAETFLNQRKRTTVELATYNENAFRFYRKIGFVDTGRRFVDERIKMKSGAVIPELEMEILPKNM